MLVESAQWRKLFGHLGDQEAVGVRFMDTRGDAAVWYRKDVRNRQQQQPWEGDVFMSWAVNWQSHLQTEKF